MSGYVLSDTRLRASQRATKAAPLGQGIQVAQCMGATIEEQQRSLVDQCTRFHLAWVTLRTHNIKAPRIENAGFEGREEPGIQNCALFHDGNPIIEPSLLIGLCRQ